jgi:hypothetical protein
VSAPTSPSGDPTNSEVTEADQQRAAAALHEAFARLQPQGSDAWNFLGAFTHLGDRYGPYHPGASALSDLLEDPGRSGSRRTGRLARLRPATDRSASADGKSELEEAMAQVVEAFRFLSARVTTLEARLVAQDHPIDGAPWLVPAHELGPWADLVVAHMSQRVQDGGVLHGDCGRGDLLDALTLAGLSARGVEPRGAVALHALERGCTVTIGEAFDLVASLPPGSLGGVVLSGMVDRLPLHRVLPLLSQVRRILGLNAPLVVVATDPAQADQQWDATARDLIEGRPLHERTWDLLLDRAGFVGMAPLSAEGVTNDGRFAIAASTPA